MHIECNMRQQKNLDREGNKIWINAKLPLLFTAQINPLFLLQNFPFLLEAFASEYGLVHIRHRLGYIVASAFIEK